MALTLSATDIIASIGAAAWLPQIFGWVYNFFTKPFVTIIPDKTVSIGYTMFGPIFNLRLAINIEKKDALIDFLGVELCHQSGSKYSFEWAGMNEFFSEVKNDKGENQVIQRDIIPISVKLNTLSLIERFFRFQDSGFIKNNKIEIDKLIEHQQFMRKQDINYHDKFLIGKEFADYLKFMRENFYWQAGKYTVTFITRAPIAIKLQKSSFEFILTQDNIDFLKNNLDQIKPQLEFNIKKPDLPDYDGQPGVWLWLYPNLSRNTALHMGEHQC